MTLIKTFFVDANLLSHPVQPALHAVQADGLFLGDLLVGEPAGDKLNPAPVCLGQATLVLRLISAGHSGPPT